MSGAVELAALQELVAKQAITEILYLYARGWDRKDKDALHACFHSDATIGSGAFEGSAEEFIASGLKACACVRAMSHIITNPMIALRGTTAISECSFLAHHRHPAPDGGEEDMFLKGRYLDRFKCGDDGWKIARREAYADFERILSPADRTLSAAPTSHRGRFKPDDTLYSLIASL